MEIKRLLEVFVVNSSLEESTYCQIDQSGFELGLVIKLLFILQHSAQLGQNCNSLLVFSLADVHSRSEVIQFRWIFEFLFKFVNSGNGIVILACAYLFLHY